MTANTSDEKIGGASESAPQTRVFVSRKHGFKVTKRAGGVYFLKGRSKGFETRNFSVIFDCVEMVYGLRMANLLKKRLT
jgi:hypothetical protein